MTLMTKVWTHIGAQWRVIGAATIVGAVLAFTIVALVPAKFQTTMQILVVQNQSADRNDASAAVQLTTHFTHVMANAIHTTSFFHKVQEAPFEVRKNFANDPSVRQKQWASTVRVTTNKEASTILIRVNDPSRTTAEATANGIAYVLTAKNHDYRGTNDGVVVRMIDGPTTPLTPTLPRIMPWTLFGAAVGCVITCVVVVFFPQYLPSTQPATRDTVRGVRYDDEMQADLAFVQRRDDDPISAHAITAHFRPVATRSEPRNLPIVDPALFVAEDMAMPVTDDEATVFTADDAKSDVTALSQEVDAEVEDLHAQISAFHKNNPS